jgi:hypothetical protein
LAVDVPIQPGPRSRSKETVRPASILHTVPRKSQGASSRELVQQPRLAKSLPWKVVRLVTRAQSLGVWNQCLFVNFIAGCQRRSSQGCNGEGTHPASPGRIP